MEFRITQLKKTGFHRFVYCLLFIILFQNTILGQSVPINAVLISNQNEVDFSSNSIDGNLSTKAEIRASSGLLLGIGAYSGFLELDFLQHYQPTQLHMLRLIQTIIYFRLYWVEV